MQGNLIQTGIFHFNRECLPDLHENIDTKKGSSHQIDATGINFPNKISIVQLLIFAKIFDLFYQPG